MPLGKEWAASEPQPIAPFRRSSSDYTLAAVAVRARRHLTVLAFLLTVTFAFLSFSSLRTVFLDAYGNGPHPLTAICALLYSCALFGGGVFKRQTPLRRGLFGATLAIGLLRLAEIYLLDRAPMTALAETVFGVDPINEIHMGVNTAVAFVFLSLGALLRRWVGLFAYALTLFGTFLPMITLITMLVGGITGDGGMSIFTALVLHVLGISQLLVFVRAPFMRHIFTGSDWGRFVRRELLFMPAGVLLLGAMTSIVFPVENTAIEVVTIGTLIFFILYVLVTGPRYERADHARRMLERELQRQAKIDPLTGLMNRRAVRDFVHAAGNRRSHAPEDIGIILADVDHFKRVNDTSGHDEGDRVLRDVARVLRAGIRRSDVLSRWGGEEFLILLPGAGIADTVRQAEKLRSAVESEVTWSANGTPHPITLSLGVSFFVADGTAQLERAIQMADTALYTAKRQGRNQVKENAGDDQDAQGQPAPVTEIRGQRTAAS